MERKKVALYARVSTLEQKNHGYSIDAQIDELRKYAILKKYEVVGEYIDDGYSGGTLNRPSLQRLLNDVRSDKIELVLFVKLDRWFRSVSQYYKIQEILDAHKVSWLCTQEDYETITSSGNFKVNIMLSVNQQFKDATSERIKSVFNYKYKNKYYTGRCVPVGFTLVRESGGNRIVIDEDVREAVYQLFMIYKDVHSIAKTITMVKEQYGLAISRKSFETLIKSPLVHGQYKDDMEFCEGYLSKEEHDKILAVRAKAQNNRYSVAHTYIFSSMIECPNCHRNLAGQIHKPQKGYEYPVYRCNHGRYDCTFKKSIFEKRVEEFVVNDLKNKLAIYNEEHANEMEETIDEHVVDINAQLNRLNTLFIRGRISDEQYERELAVLKREETLTKNSSISIYKELDRTFNEPSYIQYYEKLNNVDKQLLFKRIIKRIYIDEDRNLRVEFKIL